MIRRVPLIVALGILSACSAMLVADGTSMNSALGHDERTASQVAVDDALTASVNRALAANSSLTSANLSANARSGVVTLVGTVGSFEARDHAIDIARNTDAVDRVINQIQVKTR